MPTKAEILEIISNEVLGRDDIAFTHSLFTQCFLPIRSLPKHQTSYEARHGHAHIYIDAGKLIDPNRPGAREQREVPAGAKARLLLTYINDQAIRRKSPIVDMGNSMRKFMEFNDVPICGTNGKEITRQVKNVAAASIMMGVWSIDENGKRRADQQTKRISDSMSFWLEKDPKQNSLWQPEMVLSPEYFETLQHHRVPLDFRAMVALQGSPRAMDVYCWLSYRLCQISRTTKIPYEALHPVFGGGIKAKRHFKEEFCNAVIEAHKFYPEAKIELENRWVVLNPSPSPVPLAASRSTQALLPRNRPVNKPKDKLKKA